MTVGIMRLQSTEKQSYWYTSQPPANNLIACSERFPGGLEFYFDCLRLEKRQKLFFLFVLIALITKEETYYIIFV